MKKTCITLILLSLSFALFAADKIPIDKIKIVSFESWWSTNNYYCAVGELKNNSEFPASIKVHIIVRDKNGKIVDVHNGWPAGSSKVQPGNTIGFKYGITKDARSSSAELSIIEVEK